MQQGAGEVQPAPLGTSIRNGANSIMSLIARERAEASQSADARLQKLGQYIEEYQKSVQSNQAAEALKLEACHRHIHEIEQRYIGLQSMKNADERLIQSLSNQIVSLKEEREYILSSSMHCSQTLDPLVSEQASNIGLVADLAKYGILYWGRNSISFGDQWLQFWNQHVSGDAQDTDMSSNDRITPKELGILLENFSGIVRRDRNTIQSLQQSVAILHKERAYLFDLCNSDSKPPIYPTAVEPDLSSAIPQPSKLSPENRDPYSCDSETEEIKDDDCPFSMKSESPLNFSKSPALSFELTDNLPVEPSQELPLF